MSDVYPGRAGHYWDKSSCITTTRGEYLLDTGYDCEFGEPGVLAATGTVATPIRKRTIRSYKGTAGASGVLGVFVDWNEDVDSMSAEDLALKGSFYMERDTLLVLRGPVSILNVGSSDIQAQETVIPADGGCEVMTATGQRSLGKAMQFIPAGMRGLVFVDPDYEKAFFGGAVYP
jgi:hypothetical protein